MATYRCKSMRKLCILDAFQIHLQNKCLAVYGKAVNGGWATEPLCDSPQKQEKVKRTAHVSFMHIAIYHFNQSSTKDTRSSLQSPLLKNKPNCVASHRFSTMFSC